MNSPKSSKNSQNAKIKLTNTQTSHLPYPVGSFLWYKTGCHGDCILSGTTKSISLDANTRTMCYEIERCLEYASKPSTIDSDIIPEEDTIPEEDIICFGAGLPVRVQVNSTLPTMEHQELKGKILFGKNNNGSVTYTVMLFPEECENCFKVEENVAHDRVQLESFVSNEVVHDHVSLQETVQVSNTHEHKSTKVHEVACKYGSDEETLSSNKSSDTFIRNPTEDKPLSTNGQETLTNFTQDRESSSSTFSGQKRSLSPSPSGMARMVTQDGSISSDEGPVSKKLKAAQPMNGNTKQSSSGGKGVTPQRVSIPGWLLKDEESRTKLNEYLKNSRTLNNLGFPIEAKGHVGEMHISAYTSSTNLHFVQRLVQKTLIQYLGDDKSDKRLLFDLGVSSGVDVRQMSSGGNMVKIVDPFNKNGSQKIWVTLTDLPMASKCKGPVGCTLLRSKVDRIRTDTGCSLKVYGDEPFEGPLKQCSPYIFLFSESHGKVNAAYNSLQKVLSGSQAQAL